jgi:hypothetical protein
MFRFLCLVLLALALVQASGLEFSTDTDQCANRCQGEESDGQCPPDCSWCACCAGARPILIAEIAAAGIPERCGSVAVEPVPCQTMPDPREIVHVPLFLS